MSVGPGVIFVHVMSYDVVPNCKEHLGSDGWAESRSRLRSNSGADIRTRHDIACCQGNTGKDAKEAEELGVHGVCLSGSKVSLKPNINWFVGNEVRPYRL